MCHRNKWVLLPEGARLKLSKAKNSQTTIDDAQYSYDVMIMERKQIGSKVTVEELMVIEGNFKFLLIHFSYIKGAFLIICLHVSRVHNPKDKLNACWNCS